ncbi:uncharacterized protein LOC135190046 [Pogoniulus pusillus]|uniref:uncharacterized protein LOC135190046 n=1 Tax=Pogoniulus pusillus TaxID=488313 RepID=UPI0030B93E72
MAPADSSNGWLQQMAPADGSSGLPSRARANQAATAAAFIATSRHSSEGDGQGGPASCPPHDGEQRRVIRGLPLRSEDAAPAMGFYHPQGHTWGVPQERGCCTSDGGSGSRSPVRTDCCHGRSAGGVCLSVRRGPGWVSFYTSSSCSALRPCASSREGPVPSAALGPGPTTASFPHSPDPQLPPSPAARTHSCLLPPQPGPTTASFPHSPDPQLPPSPAARTHSCLLPPQPGPTAASFPRSPDPRLPPSPAARTHGCLLPPQPGPTAASFPRSPDPRLPPSPAAGTHHRLLPPQPGPTIGSFPHSTA